MYCPITSTYYSRFDLSWICLSSRIMVLSTNFPQGIIVNILCRYLRLFYCPIVHRWELSVLHYHEIMVIYPYPFLVVITQLFSCIVFINDFICILTGSPGSYLFMIIYVIQEIGDNENSPYSLNVMVNYHYHSENRVITRKIPSML